MGPLVLACLVDRIIMGERAKGYWNKFRNTLGLLLFQMIFKRWQLGTVPGSQFLANLLITWERSGFFQGKHLEPCKRPLRLLVAYARSNGVADSDKDLGVGWYKIIQREANEEEGCEAIAGKKRKIAAAGLGPATLPEASVEIILGKDASSSTAPTD